MIKSVQKINFQSGAFPHFVCLIYHSTERLSVFRTSIHIITSIQKQTMSYSKKKPAWFRSDHKTLLKRFQKNIILLANHASRIDILTKKFFLSSAENGNGLCSVLAISVRITSEGYYVEGGLSQTGDCILPQFRFYILYIHIYGRWRVTSLRLYSLHAADIIRRQKTFLR